MKSFPEMLVATDRIARATEDREVGVVPMRTRIRARRFSREEIAEDLIPGGFSALEAQNLRRRLAAIRRRGEMPSSAWNEPRNS